MFALVKHMQDVRKVIFDKYYATLQQAISEGDLYELRDYWQGSFQLGAPGLIARALLDRGASAIFERTKRYLATYRDARVLDLVVNNKVGFANLLLVLDYFTLQELLDNHQFEAATRLVLAEEKYERLLQRAALYMTPSNSTENSLARYLYFLLQVFTHYNTQDLTPVETLLRDAWLFSNDDTTSAEEETKKTARLLAREIERDGHALVLDFVRKGLPKLYRLFD